MSFAALAWYGGYAMGRYFTALELLAAVVAVAIFASSLDDLFVDAWYWSRELYRHFTVKRRYRPLTVEELHGEGDEPGLTAEALAEKIGEPLSTDDDA